MTHAVVEFVAPTEYMVRPPQPAVYIFLIDVSHSAIQSGTYPISKHFLVGLCEKRHGGYCNTNDS